MTCRSDQQDYNRLQPRTALRAVGFSNTPNYAEKRENVQLPIYSIHGERKIYKLEMTCVIALCQLR